MIAEVPTIAIEHVYVWNNTSVIVDEVLAQRLGLVPLNVDPDLFETRGCASCRQLFLSSLNSDVSTIPAGGDATDRNTLVFKLDVTCSRIKPPPTSAAKSSSSTTAPSINAPYDTLKNGLVTASQLVWEPQGEQAELLRLIAKRPAATNGDIVLAKLRPGQAIEMEMHAVKGVGKDHAKFSPVGACAALSRQYRPTVSLLRRSQQRRQPTAFFQLSSSRRQTLFRHTSLRSSRHVSRQASYASTQRRRP